MATTKRADVTAGLLSVLTTFKNANPTLLHAVYPSRPGSFPETPCAFVGVRDETIAHDSGTRRRTFAATVVLVDVLIDNEQTGDRLDVLVDGLVDAFTAAPAVIEATMLQQTGVTDGELDLTGPTTVVHYRAVTLTFGEIIFQEGRN